MKIRPMYVIEVGGPSPAHVSITSYIIHNNGLVLGLVERFQHYKLKKHSKNVIYRGLGVCTLFRCAEGQSREITVEPGPLTCCHPSNKDHLTGPKGGWFRGVPLYHYCR